jgi:hypothetical protein
MFKSVSTVVTITAVLISILCGALFVVSLAAGRLWLTFALAAAAAVTAWVAFSVPTGERRR